MSRNKTTIFVMLSGGVDSSTAAALLKKEGYTLVGCHIKCYNIDGCGEKDAEDARRVAEKLDIPFYIFDLEEEYKNRVVKYMVDGYRQGITPNPDVACNTEIKFGLFLEKATEMGADYVASGHYAILKKEGSAYHLYQGVDDTKDQSYFLWNLSQEQLARIMFPLGELTKREVRELARSYHLPTAEKKDSQGICFLGKISLRDFLKKHIPPQKGDIVDTRGRKVGEHEGSWMYTVGQRHGLTLETKRSVQDTFNKRETPAYYVVKKDNKKNVVVVAQGEAPESQASKMIITQVNVVNQTNDNNVRIRIRYRQPLELARITKKEKTTWTIVCDKPQKYIAEGQSLVAYSDTGELLFGGIIQSIS